MRTLAFVSVCFCLVLSAQASDEPQRLRRLEAAVQAEEAIRAIKRLQYACGHYLDSGLQSEAVALFTDDAKPDARRQVLAQADSLHVHLLLQPIVTLGPDGKTARGTWHEMTLLGKFGTTASWVGGVYENEYALDHGVWKIKRQQFFEQYRGAYDDFGHKAPAKWNIPYHFEPAHVGVTIPQSALQALTDAASGARAEQLAARVQRLEDETQVRNLQHIFGYYLDRKLWDDVADLFADEGSLESGQRGVYVGKAHIRRALEVFYGAPPLRHGELFDHINLGTVVTIAPDGRSARARTSQLSMLGLVGTYAQWEEGTYENEYVKRDGVWKLKAVRYAPRVTTDYDAGWARDAQPAPGPSKDFPPDHAPTQAYASYPKTSRVAIHFANPVTGKPVRSGAAQSSASLDDLEHRLDAEIAVDAVENLNSSYGYYIDESAWDNMADTFASSGSKEITAAGVYVGPDRIRKVLNLRGPRGGRTANFFTIHQLTQPVIHIAPDGNSARARLRLFQCGGNADGSSGSWIGGIYENTAVKEDGEWKFGVQELYHIYNASYRNGWARVGAEARAHPLPDRVHLGRDVVGGGITQGLGGASSGSRIASEMPPDRPIVARQYAFPDIVEPPFHYRNPVTGRLPATLLP